MTDVTRIPPADVARITQVFENRPTARPTEVTAAPKQRARSIEEVIAQRLDTATAPAKPTSIERDVPRGTYLDIVV